MVGSVQVENGDFGEGFYQYDSIGELTVPNGWRPWWTEGKAEDIAEGYLKRPEYSAEERRVHTGDCAVKWFSTFATHDGGLYQQVAVPIGVLLSVTAEVQYWSEHTDGSGGGYGVQIGIDAGSTSVPSAECVWGSWRGQDDGDWDGKSWRTVCVAYLCDKPMVTLYLRGVCRFRAKHNDSYWDHVVLQAEVPGRLDDELLEYLRAVEQQARKIGARIQEIHDLFGRAIEG